MASLTALTSASLPAPANLGPGIGWDMTLDVTYGDGSATVASVPIALSVGTRTA